MNKKWNLAGALVLGTLFAASSASAKEMKRAPVDDTYPGYTQDGYMHDGYMHNGNDLDQPRTLRPKQEEQQSVSQDKNYYGDKTIKDEILGVAPELGVLSFTSNGSYTSRALAGAGVNFNIIPLAADHDSRDWYAGVSTGLLYSHTGAGNGNFFGNADSANNNDANLMLIPVDAKIGYNIGDAFRVSVHGGGNIIYRSVANAIDLGADSNTGDSLWRIYPNAGADAEWQVGKNVSLMLRPDLTFTSGTSLFAATLGATIIGI